MSFWDGATQILSLSSPQWAPVDRDTLGLKNKQEITGVQVFWGLSRCVDPTF